MLTQENGGAVLTAFEAPSVLGEVVEFKEGTQQFYRRELPLIVGDGYGFGVPSTARADLFVGGVGEGTTGVPRLGSEHTG